MDCLFLEYYYDLSLAETQHVKDQVWGVPKYTGDWKLL